ncbi:MAG: hypothetical protein LBB10_01775, partial [Bifidobacteriaceae bacterium]|nr:hypothetical protein [Bifidobacteriaceae bacterium]
MKNRINKIGAALTILTFGIICGIGGYELRSFTDSASSPLPISKGGTGTNSFPANSVITGNGALPMSSRGIDAVPQPSSNAVLTSGGAYNAYSSIQGAGQFIFRLGTAELGGQYITFRYDPNTKILHFSQNTGAKNFTWGAGEADRHVNIILKLPTGWKITFSDALGYQSLEGNGTHRYGG